MILELIATVSAGLGAGGVAVALRRVTGRRLPRWVVPTAAGCAMLGVTIANEYTWFERTRDSLPEGVVVAATHERQEIYRPWTYLAPYTDRFVAVDRASIRTHPARPERRLLELFFHGRWSQPRQVSVVVDCARHTRARVTAATQFGDEGRIANVTWRKVGADDPIQQTACAESS
jgi:hypothetical protein